MSNLNEYKADNWQEHIMGPSSGKKPFNRFENKKNEISAVDGALSSLVSASILTETTYNLDCYDMFCSSVKSNFEIPWTGISPRMRRLIYSINAIHKPQNVVCAGIFCGYTFICNAGASIGKGACYKSSRLYGIEVLSKEALRAKGNIKRFSKEHQEAIICADAAKWVDSITDFKIDLLYIDAKSIDFDPNEQNDAPSASKSEYLKIIEAAKNKLNKGALILAHNSVNAYDEIADYLEYVRSENFTESINLIVDDAGLEVTKSL